MPLRKITFYNLQTHEIIYPSFPRLYKEDFYIFFDPESFVVKNMIPDNWSIDSIVYYPDDKSLYYTCLGGVNNAT